MSTRSCAAVFALLAACSGGAGGGDDEPAIDARVIDAALIDAPVIDGPAIDARVIDAAPGSNTGFVLPMAVTKANANSGGVWTEIGDADWSCLGTPSTDQASTGSIALSGTVVDFQTGNGVGAASITAWSTSPAATVGTATSDSAAATRGQFSMTLGMLPSGTRRYGFALTAASYVNSIVLDRYYPPGAAATDLIPMLSEATATALPAFIGVTRDPQAALYVGEMADCQGRQVSNAVVGVSTTSSTYSNGGGDTYYFSAGSTSLPVRHTVEPVMNNDGLFVVINTPPSTAHYLQVWGFRTQQELSSGVMTLLAEVPAPSQTGQAVNVRLRPRRT